FAIFFAISGHSQNFSLGLNLVKGATYEHIQNMKSDIIENVNGQEIKTQLTVYGKTGYLVEGFSGENYKIKVTYESLKMTIQNGDHTVSFNSEKKDSENVLSAVLSQMVNKSFYLTLTKKGKVEEVHGLDSIFAHLLDRFPDLPAAQKSQFESQMKNAYGEKSMKSAIELITSVFPDRAVKKGDKWNANIHLESGFAGNETSVYELKGISDSTFLIEGTGTVKTEDKDAYIQSNGMPLKYNLKGTSISNIEIDKKTGWIVNAEIDQKVDGTIDIKDNPKLPGGMLVPITLIYKNSIRD
ncbi:MAG: DUF6263 family protein, partial [Ginsengibacter sp.]